MTVLDKSISFVRIMPAVPCGTEEDAMAAKMESFSDESAFTFSEIAELVRRLAEGKTEYAVRRDMTCA